MDMEHQYIIILSLDAHMHKARYYKIWNVYQHLKTLYIIVSLPIIDYSFIQNFEEYINVTFSSSYT